MRPAHRVLAVMAALALVAATVLVHRAVVERRASFPAEEDVLYLPRASALKAMSLGHHELAADLVFIRAIIYFGGELAGHRQYKWLENYLQTIVDLDPDWKTPYRWAGVATMYHGNAITRANVLASNHFLELGAKQFPGYWEFPFMLGCNYLFELKTDDEHQKAEWHRQGGEWIRRAALSRGAPAWAPLLAATIMRKEGQEEAALRHLEEVYAQTDDPQMREDVRNRLLSLHAKVDFAKAQRERDEFVREWQRAVPYASPDFFVAVGPRRSPRLDLEELTRDPVLQEGSGR